MFRFKVGDLVICGRDGVCRVEDIGVPDALSIDPGRTYYTMVPLYRSGVNYIPVDSTVFMRPVISGSEARRFIEEIPAITPHTYEESNPRLISEYYDTLLRSHSCHDLVLLIKTVYKRGLAASALKKKMGVVDSRYIHYAEERLHGELAVALGIPKDDVKDYIAQRVEKIA